MEKFHLSAEQAEAEVSAFCAERSSNKELPHLSGLNRVEAICLRSALRSKGIKCRIMPVPIGEQGDTQLR